MEILVVHNRYQNRGGEDSVCEAEIELLRGMGHEVTGYARHNDEMREFGALQKLGLGWNTTWANRSHTELRDLIERTSPDIVHFHNIFPLISPSAYYACADVGVPVVQTLHNFRLLCPAATFLRDGKVCELCLGRTLAWPAVLHGCYRDSRAATFATAGMLAVHRGLRTWRQKVDVYVALSGFARKKFIAGGIPANRIVVKPNFVSHEVEPNSIPGQHALYAGRLSEEKGIRTLLSTVGKLSTPAIIKIAGEGPLFDEASRQVTGMQVELLGQVPRRRIIELMHGARFVVVPSVCYENFPLVIAESFACGVPVIASRLGSLAEVVEDGRTGLLFTPGDAQDLAAKIDWAWSNPDVMTQMGRDARREYEAKYTAERNYRMLMDIYEMAIAFKTGKLTAPVVDEELVKD